MHGERFVLRRCVLSAAAKKFIGYLDRVRICSFFEYVHVCEVLGI